MSAPQPLARLLDAHPLPSAEGDKHDRGVAVFVAGSAECPGAAVLAAIGALRAGAGKVQIITAPEVTSVVGVAVPESLVVGWNGDAPDDSVQERLERADAVCIGPGIIERAPEMANALIELIAPDVPVLLDALALPAAGAFVDAGRTVIVAPNLDEARDMLTEPLLDQGIEALAAALTSQLRVPVAVRGEMTVVAHGESAWWTKGAPGLGTSGSGDVLAGIVTGLLARGLDHTAALGWGIGLHISAGRALGRDRRNPGYLARELLDVLPDVLSETACPDA